MSELLDKIRSRGHWRVVIRPAHFDEKRISNVGDLYPILQKTAVQLSGWDFPHLGSRQPAYNLDHIGQETDWEYYVELWRFHQSGKFIHYSGLREDWQNQCRVSSMYNAWEPGAALDPLNVILKFTEIFELASRLTFTVAADNWMNLEITVNGIKGRSLRDKPGGLHFPGENTAHIEKKHYRHELTKVQLMVHTRELALELAGDLFQHFSWNPSNSLLRDIQSDLLRKGSSVSRL
jgi:hypothetical protein